MKNGYDFRSKEERLRTTLGILGYKIFTLRGWFGKGFVALDTQFARQHVLIFRKKGDEYVIQPLDSVNHVRSEQVEHMRIKSRFSLEVQQLPYNPTKRKLNYSWQWLVLVKEQREYIRVWNGRELTKDEARMNVGAPVELSREPAPRRISVMPVKEHWRDRKPKHGTWK